MKAQLEVIPDSKVHEANMGPIWGRQDPGGPHVGPMNFAIRDIRTKQTFYCFTTIIFLRLLCFCYCNISVNKLKNIEN